MPTTKNDLMMLLYRLADELAPNLGIKDTERFVEALASIIGYEDPSWDPAASGDNGHSIGLFQLHDQGEGAGMSVAQRSDAETNIRKAISYLGPIWASSETQGLTFEGSVQRMISEGQQPADPALAYRRAMAAHSQVERELPAAAPGAGTQQDGSEQDFIAWLKSHGFGSYVETVGGKEYAIDPGTGGPVPSWLGQAFVEDTMGTTTGQTPEEAGETMARTGLYRAQTGEIAQTQKNYISEQERNDKQQEFENKIEDGTLKLNEAIAQFNAWYDTTQEARLRAETEFTEANKRAVWTTPEEYYPGTEPGGVNAQMYEKAGLPTYPSAKGVPISQMPSLEDTYAKWSQNLGVSQQAPPMGAATTGPTAAQAFIQDLLAKHQARTQSLPAMAGGGWMPRNKPFIAGELGPEVIQPGAAGIAVTPIGADAGFRRYVGDRTPYPRPAPTSPKPTPIGTPTSSIRAKPYATELSDFIETFRQQYGRQPGATEVYDWWQTAKYGTGVGASYPGPTPRSPATPVSVNPQFAAQAYRNWLASRRVA